MIKRAELTDGTGDSFTVSLSGIELCTEAGVPFAYGHDEAYALIEWRDGKLVVIDVFHDRAGTFLGSLIGPPLVAAANRHFADEKGQRALRDQWDDLMEEERTAA